LSSSADWVPGALDGGGLPGAEAGVLGFFLAGL
jgi:hypothetical protein